MPHLSVAISDTDKKLLTKAYRGLLRSIRNPLSAEDRSMLDKAFQLGMEAHSRQRRKSGEPYFLHPIEVARICYEEIGLGPTAITSALLHDVVEDTPVTIEEIKEQFGPKIGKIVDGLTKLDGLYNVESPQAENFKKVISTLVEDVRVVLIKMADRLHNLRTIAVMPRHKQLKIAAETSYIYAPLAHRLGLYNIRTEFQDICMQITEPEAHEEILTKLKESAREQNRYINEFIKPLKNELDSIEYGYKIFGRPKSISSIWNKIKSKKVPFEEIYDLFAVRIVVDVPKEKEKQVCWQIYSIVTDVHRPIPERLKDWITTPKSNGYESLHTTVIGPKGRYVEVQIRSERMDEIAERGFAAHWKYKGLTDHNLYENWLDNIRDILDDPHNDAIEFINDFKTNLFQEEVYVFTPRGDMRVLPKGATALDFAFSIHTDIGYHATAIKVNNKLVPMGYRLESGDQVQVTTNKNQRPSEDWLKMVMTGKARSKVRSAMKEEQRKKGEYGKESLERKLKNLKLDFETNVDFLVHNLGYKSRPDLYYAIATDQFNLTHLNQFTVVDKKFIQPERAPADVSEQQEVYEPARTFKKIDSNTKLLINGESADTYSYTFANCCSPVQGDDIIAYLTSNAGLKIHRINCKNVPHLLANYGYRVMKAEWANTGNSNFVVDLLITGVDDGPGVIERLSHHISTQLGLNIRSFAIAGNEGYFEGKVSIIVANKDQLNIAIKSIEKIPGISSAVRHDKSI
jgi:GTP diphosphokinase / guanosine-3',5'-bis(diphosphate) 3'-diphosphatase